MAKLHKISMFVLDVEEIYENIDEFIEEVIDQTCASVHFIESDTAQFPWYDNIILNDQKATKNDYEDFMNETRRCRLQTAKAVVGNSEKIKKAVQGIMENLGLQTSAGDMIEFLKQTKVYIEQGLESD